MVWWMSLQLTYVSRLVLPLPQLQLQCGYLLHHRFQETKEMLKSSDGMIVFDIGSLAQSIKMAGKIPRFSTVRRVYISYVI